MAPVYEPDRDFYKLLGLKPTTASSEQVVRQAYLRCARKAHPDRDRTNDAATGNFQDIQEAYETLKDPAKKIKYDKAILEWSLREDKRRKEEARKREDEAWARSRSRRRGGPAPFGQFGQEKYFPYDARAPKAGSSKPPPGASTAWEEMKRARPGGKFGQSASGPQKPANPPQRPGPHPTAKTPKKPAQRQGSFAQWAKEYPAGPETPGKNGYRPDSSTMGDEPRAKNNSYSSAKKTDYFSSHGDSDSDNIESILKSRARQPYQKVYGEKTKLFEEQMRSSEEESRGSKQAKASSTPRKDEKSAGTQPFWPHPETTPEFSGATRNESTRPHPEPAPFERTPTASPGPWFTKEAPPNAFTFTAGSETSADAPPVRKTRSSGHLGRKNTASPTKRRRPEATESPAQSGEPAAESPSFKFDPKAWTQTFKPENFIPEATQQSSASASASTSPTRQARSNLKRSATMGASSSSTPQRATVVDDTSGDEGGAGLKGDKPKPAGATHAPSPNAMDIDSPPHRPSAGPTPAAGTTPERASSTRTRAVPVEPSKPEWRAGTGAGQAKEAPKKAPVPPLKPTTGGSEDTDEFRATLDDLKNVPPFAPQGGGLGSLGDLKSNLPFSSKPSESIPVKPASYKPLEVPRAPAAPVFPAPVGTNGIRPTRDIIQTYVRAFESYLTQWDTYNGIIVGHFRERQKIMSGEARGAELGAAKQRIRERLGAARQDAGVRRQWAEACEEHERRVEEHLQVLEKMGAV